MLRRRRTRLFRRRSGWLSVGFSKDRSALCSSGAVGGYGCVNNGFHGPLLPGGKRRTTSRCCASRCQTVTDSLERSLSQTVLLGAVSAVHGTTEPRRELEICARCDAHFAAGTRLPLGVSPVSPP